MIDKLINWLEELQTKCRTYKTSENFQKNYYFTLCTLKIRKYQTHSKYNFKKNSKFHWVVAFVIDLGEINVFYHLITGIKYMKY